VNRTNEAHLDPGRIIASIVDDRELSPGEREHLSTCPACVQARASLASRLAVLSGQAERHIPSSRQRVVLPVERPSGAMGRLVRWSLGGAAAIATVVVVAVFLLGRPFPGGLQGVDGSNLAHETAQDEVLLAEVRALENDPLPAAYSEIIPDPDVSLDEDFFEFLIPLGSNGEEALKT